MSKINRVEQCLKTFVCLYTSIVPRAEINVCFNPISLFFVEQGCLAPETAGIELEKMPYELGKFFGVHYKDASDFDQDANGFEVVSINTQQIEVSMHQLESDIIAIPDEDLQSTE